MIDKKLYSLSGNIKKYMIFTTTLSCLKLLATIYFSWLFAFLLKDLISSNFNQNYLFIIFSILGIILVREFSTKMIAKSLGDLVVDTKKNLRNTIFNKIIKLGLNYTQFFKTQEFIHLSVDNVEQLETYFGGYLTQFYYCIISSLILFLAVAKFNLRIALILLIFSLAIPLFLYISLNKVKKIQRKYFSKYMNVGTLFLDSLQGLTTLKLYGSDEITEKRIHNISEEFRKETMRVLKMQLLSIAIVNWIIFAGTILAIIYAIKLFMAGNLNLLGLFFILMISPEFFLPMRTLTALFHVAMTGVAAAENIMSFLNANENKSLGQNSFPKNADISIENFNFSYPDGTVPLKNVSLNFKKANLTALVGFSGCGKSTLSSILAGEINSDEKNKIKIGTLSLNDIQKEALPLNILKTTHDSHIFGATLRENLLLANSNANDSEMIEILKQVKLWKVFEKLNGLDTVLESQGKNLSGGQAQRVALARALLYNAAIYIFDEATSNIDIESEKIIVDTIHKIAKTKTVIFISHRLASVVNADNIYVMEKGSIVQEGKHQELLSKEGIYKNLFEKQEEIESFLKVEGDNKNE